MTRSRHRRSGGSGEPASLPSWAQRHLDESGYEAAPVTTRHRRAAGRPAGDTPLRGWGLAVLSVAAAVTAVPLAISAVANDRSDDPLPTVDTFTAGAPQDLEGGPGGTTTRRGAAGVAGDEATAGILTVPGVAPGSVPGAPPVAAPAPVVPAPLPAAVVRPTTPATLTPRAATPTSTPTGTSTTTSPSKDEGKSATKPSSSTSKPSKPSKPSTSSDSSDASDSPSSSRTGERDGPVTGLVKGVGNTVGGVTGALGL